MYLYYFIVYIKSLKTSEINDPVVTHSGHIGNYC